MNFSGNTKITWKHTFMITKKIYILLCFQIFLLRKTLFVMNRLFLFKELSKIFREFWGKFKDFSRTWCFFKDFLRPLQTMCQYISFIKARCMVFLLPWEWWIKTSLYHRKNSTSEMITSAIENITASSYWSTSKTTRLRKEDEILVRQ